MSIAEQRAVGFIPAWSLAFLQINSDSDKYNFKCQGDSSRSGLIFSEYYNKFSSEFPRLSVGWEKIGMDVDMCYVWEG